METERQTEPESRAYGNAEPQRKSGGISLRTFVIIIGAVLLIFGIGAAVMIHNEPDPRPLAPGPHYHYEDPLENI